MAYRLRQSSLSTLPQKVVLQCHRCTGLVVSYICFEHHIKDCCRITRTQDLWKPPNYAPLRQHDMNTTHLCKWLDCKHCKLQQILAASKPSSFLGLRMRRVSWCRFVYLLLARLKVRHVWNQTCRQPALDVITVAMIISYVTWISHCLVVTWTSNQWWEDTSSNRAD